MKTMRKISFFTLLCVLINFNEAMVITNQNMDLNKHADSPNDKYFVEGKVSYENNHADADADTVEGLIPEAYENANRADFPKYADNNDAEPFNAAVFNRHFNADFAKTVRNKRGAVLSNPSGCLQGWVLKDLGAEGKRCIPISNLHIHNYHRV